MVVPPFTLSKLLLNQNYQFYTLPSRLQYIASSDDISNPAVPMRIRQICTFMPLTSPTGEHCWIGITTSQIFS
jgi:hypothetical protein